jgi:transcription antitermination factor NusG
MLDVLVREPLQPSHLECREHRQCGCYPDAWAVIQTHPQAEFWATANLKRQGYTTYLPLYATKRLDRALRTLSRVVMVPLFQSYVFVKISPDDPWYPIRRTAGVRQLLLSAFGKPYLLRPGSLEAVRATEAQRTAPTSPSAIWAQGMPCSLAAGPFADHQGVVMSVGRDMALVALMMFGHLREVAVQLDCLRARDE